MGTSPARAINQSLTLNANHGHETDSLQVSCPSPEYVNVVTVYTCPSPPSFLCVCIYSTYGAYAMQFKCHSRREEEKNEPCHHCGIQHLQLEKYKKYILTLPWLLVNLAALTENAGNRMDLQQRPRYPRTGRNHSIKFLLYHL